MKWSVDPCQSEYHHRASLPDIKHSPLREEKLDPSGPAYKKWKASKKFDPSRSEVLAVMRAQEAGPRRL